MKQRIISATLGLVLLVMILMFYQTPVLNIALAFLSMFAVYEILVNTKFVTRILGIFCALYAGIGVLTMNTFISIYVMTIPLFVTVVIACMLVFHNRVSFSQASICIFSTIGVPFSFATIMLMLDAGCKGPIYIVLTCIAAWVTDSGAYFIGTFWGKRKLIPNISPNKTIEGAIGGLVITGLIFSLTCYGYWRLVLVNVEFSLFNAVMIGVICALFGMLGDLFASAMKREAGIKDFGNVMPGHGGIMDRFDSFLFAAPALLYLINLFPIYKMV